MIPVLSSYTLSRDFRLKVEDKLGSPCEFIALSDLKRLGFAGIVVRALRTKTGEIYIACEEESSRLALPTLEIIAFFFRCSTIRVITPKFEILSSSRVRILGYFLSIVRVNIWSRVALLVSWLELNYLQRKVRILPVVPTTQSLFYLKSNLWFGVKAGGSVGHIAGVINGFLRKKWSVKYFGVEPPVMTDKELLYEEVSIPPVLAFPPELNNFVYNRELYKKAVASDGQPFLYQRLSINNYAGVLLSRKKKVPLIIEYNGSEVWVAHNWGNPLRYKKLAKLAEDVCLAHAHFVVTISEVLKEELIGRGVEKGKIVTYPNCIDESIFNPKRFVPTESLTLRRRLGVDIDDVLLTFVGTFGQWHGVDFLAETIVDFVRFDEEWLDSHKVKFLLVGDGALMEKVKKILTATNTAPYVVLTGLVEQAMAPLYLYASDVLLSPHLNNADGTKFFGSPTKLFEYMAMGKPIVASDLEQIGEVLREGEGPNAALFCPGDREAFKSAIKRVVENQTYATELATNARRLALSKYTWNHHVDRILERTMSIESLL